MLPDPAYDKLVTHQDSRVASLAGKLQTLANSLLDEEEPDVYSIPTYDEIVGKARYKADRAGI